MRDNEPIQTASHRASRRDIPADPVETPAFVVHEDAVLRNLEKTIKVSGGPARLMPHVKTHRAPWVVAALRNKGVEAFKAATLAELEMVARGGARTATLAFTTVNPANIARFVRCAQAHPETNFVGILDSQYGLEAWRAHLRNGQDNIRMRVDLDPGFGRTGAPMTDAAVDLAAGLHELNRFAGWHLYDGHIHGPVEERRVRVEAEAEAVRKLNERLARKGISGDLVAGGSYTFDLWPTDVAQFVSPGSWTYSSASHDRDLPNLNWEPAAFVLATVVSEHDGTVTLDAGAKAIAPDKPLKERFRINGEIMLIAEEHAVVRTEGLALGDRILLVPEHACTTAYLYDRAWVRTTSGGWERRDQLGSTR
ncbi:alanine racemase [Rhodobacteraceae bacterium WD3A24]|nr:alanine racemase [Rhodobacteraceae bacterium WD3A24]